MKATYLLCVAAALSTLLAGCLPEELDDTALADYCKIDGDCAKKEAYACVTEVKCTANRCTKGSGSIPQGDIHECSTPSCAIAGCHCGKPGPQSPAAGKCVKP